MNWRLAVVAAFVAAALSCGEIRIVPVADAAAERRPLTMRVRGVSDTLTLDQGTEPSVSHVVHVDVLDGPDEWRGRSVSLPYDEWTVGAPPPRAGDVVTASPARWVRGDGTSHGKPAEGWGRARSTR